MLKPFPAVLPPTLFLLKLSVWNTSTLLHQQAKTQSSQQARPQSASSGVCVHPLQRPLHSWPHLSTQSWLKHTQSNKRPLPLLSSRCSFFLAAAASLLKPVSPLLPTASNSMWPVNARFCCTATEPYHPGRCSSETSSKGLSHADWAPLTNSWRKKWGSFQCQRGLDLPQSD